MKNIYFIRHGQSEANVDHDILKTREDSSIPLTKKGIKDAKNAGEKLKELLANDKNEPTVYVSPWSRTKQTCEQIYGKLHLSKPPKVYPGIAEHFMNLVGNEENWEKFSQFKASNWSIKDFVNVTYEGGESLGDVMVRADKFVEFLSGFPEGPIIVVSHGQFIKMVLAIIDGTDPDSIPHPQNGEVIKRELGIKLNSYDQLNTFCTTKKYKIIADGEDYGLMRIVNPRIPKRVSVHVRCDSTRQILEKLKELED